MALSMGAQLAGVRVRGRVTVARRGGAARRPAAPVAALTKQKVVSYDDNWKRGIVTTGLFVEDSEQKGRNFLKKAEEKKLLSQVEKLGLLSTAEKAGFTLSKIESLKLLSTAEKLGALSLLEKAASSDGATISSLSIPPFVITALGIVLIPDDTTAELAAQAGIVAVFGTAFLVLFAGGFLINSLNE